MSEEQIRSCFAFEESDLIANRTGRLSENQSKRVKAVDQFAERFLLALFFIFLTAGILVAILAYTSTNNIGLWIAAILLFLIAGWLFRGVQTDVDDTVHKAQGEVNFVKMEKQDGSVNDASSKRTAVSSYEMRVGDEIFRNVNPALIEYMQGGTYVVYFTRATRQILSVEQASNGSSSAPSNSADHD